MSIQAHLSPSAIVQLQRTIGNRAVSQLLQQQNQGKDAAQIVGRKAAPLPRISQQSSTAVQRAIGLEIEVSVPVDQLTNGEEGNIRNAAGATLDGAPKNTPIPLMQFRGKNKPVAYTRGNGPKPTNGNFRAEVDHDPRVNSERKPPFPFRDLNNSAILEIVTEPKADKAEFDTAMNDVDAFVGDVNTRTNNLTTHAHDPFGSGHNVGPIDYNFPMPKQPEHNWKGSVQVNIGVDMREYASLAKWYAKSSYSDPSKAERHARGDYKRVRENIKTSIDIGRQMTTWLKSFISKTDIKAMGDLRGLRGWMTHMALYMVGSRNGLPEGSTAKNITPILMKSPNDVAIYYGMTPDERDYYLEGDNRKLIMAELIKRTKRTDLDPINPLASAFITDKDGGYSLDDLSEEGGHTLFAGAPIGGEQPVGPARTGEGASDAPNTGTGERGGAVVEFRNLPGFYEGPAAWRQLGYDFLRQAENRNKRSGHKPDKLSKLQGDEWN
ncbi:MAG TPA: hypothetical protein VG722_12815 [Tepidisphaeraceae bacterium]|nr:hypothetical protein [Tepidisphaeraceae bacterium]